MPVQSVENRSAESRSEVIKIFPVTGMVHRFRNPTEFVSIKTSEIGADRAKIMQIYNNPGLVIEENCNNRLCGAPPSAHVLARAA